MELKSLQYQMERKKMLICELHIVVQMSSCILVNIYIVGARLFRCFCLFPPFKYANPICFSPHETLKFGCYICLFFLSYFGIPYKICLFTYSISEMYRGTFRQTIASQSIVTDEIHCCTTHVQTHFSIQIKS